MNLLLHEPDVAGCRGIGFDVLGSHFVSLNEKNTS